MDSEFEIVWENVQQFYTRKIIDTIKLCDIEKKIIGRG